jgi:hypothetical protein
MEPVIGFRIVILPVAVIYSVDMFFDRVMAYRQQRPTNVRMGSKIGQKISNFQGQVTGWAGCVFSLNNGLTGEG